MSGNGGTITLRLYGALRHAVGSREVQLPGGEATVKETLRSLTQHHQRAAALLFDGQGNVWDSLILLLNEEPAAEGPATPVRSGDVVSVLMPLAGG